MTPLGLGTHRAGAFVRRAGQGRAGLPPRAENGATGSPDGMRKTNVKVDPGACCECYSCQLICSLVYAGAFNLLIARIVIRPGEISFKDECVVTCSLCTNYCAYGALTRP